MGEVPRPVSDVDKNHIFYVVYIVYDKDPIFNFFHDRFSKDYFKFNSVENKLLSNYLDKSPKELYFHNFYFYID